MIYKRCPHCGKRVPAGEKCRGCNFKRGYAKPTGTRALYHLNRWTKLREIIMNMYSRQDPFALKNGRLEAAETVHHIITAEDDPGRFWDPDNLIPLSRFSHDAVHARYRISEEEKKKCQEELRSCLKHPEW